MTGRALELDNVSRAYGPVQAVHPLSLRIEPGELVALLGPSGCGKTTTLRIVAGFEFPDSGRVLIGGEDMTRAPPNKRRLGMVFQNYGLFPHMDVGANVAFGLRMQRLNRADRDRQARDMLAMVRLTGLENRLPAQLSGGQQQRVALARALVTNPTVLLLDEPLGALDRNLREGMQFELRALQRRLGITSLMVTHDQEEALTMADRVAVMRGGRIIQDGRPEDVYARPCSRFVSEFLGTSNLFAVHRSACGDALLDMPGASIQAPAGMAAGWIALRPEAIHLVAAGQGLVDAQVEDVVFRGASVAVGLTLAGRADKIIVYERPSAARIAPPGAMVGLRWDADAVVPLADAP